MRAPIWITLSMTVALTVGCGSTSPHNPVPPEPVVINTGLMCPKPPMVPTDLQAPYAAESLIKMQKLLSK